jgi:hypothetical protein
LRRQGPVIGLVVERHAIFLIAQLGMICDDSGGEGRSIKRPPPAPSGMPSRRS